MSWKTDFLNSDEQGKVNGKLEEFANTTNSAMRICVAKASDPYPAAILRFAITASLILTLLSTLFLDFENSVYIPILNFLLVFVFMIFGRIGFLKAYALSTIEMNREVEEKATELYFTSRNEKNQNLLYISLQEKRVEFLSEQDGLDRKELRQELKNLNQMLQKQEAVIGISNFIDAVAKNAPSAAPSTSETPEDKTVTTQTPTLQYEVISWMNYS